MEYGRKFSMEWKILVWNERKLLVWNMEKSSSIPFHTMPCRWQKDKYALQQQQQQQLQNVPLRSEDSTSGNNDGVCEFKGRVQPSQVWHQKIAFNFLITKQKEFFWKIV